MTIQRVHGACPHDCPDTCGLVTEVENGRAVKFYGAAEHPVTQGWLCAKVRPYLNHVYHLDRLTHPLRRVGPKGSGQWQRLSWEEAIGEIGARWRAIIAEFGPEAILPYSYSGTLGLLQMGVVNGRFWNRLGASQLQRTICGAAAEFAVEATLGSRRSQRYEDVQFSKLVIIWGHNPVSTAPHFMPHLLQARRNDTQVAVIDPRRTRTAKLADWHIAPQPGSDGALALGLAHHHRGQRLAGRGVAGAAYSVGWPELRARLGEFPLTRVAQITGLPETDIVRLAQLYAEAQPALIKIADGLQRNFNGGQTVRAICALPALTGQYGRRGGGLAYTTSGYMQWDSEAINKWAECPPPGRSVNMNRLGAALLGEVNHPPIQSLFVFGANPAASNPNAGRVKSGLQREDLFTVVHELFMTDASDYADIVLPATSQLEQVDLHKGYGHTCLTYNRPAIAPLDEAKSNWQVMCLLAQEMGFTEPWLRQSADEVLDEVLTATAVTQPEFAGITLDKLKAAGTIPLAIELEVPFADGRFPTPSGKIELYSQTMAEMGLDPLPGWQDVVDSGGQDESLLNGHFPAEEALTLLSGASHHFTSSTFANQADLLAREGEPFVEIHPHDATRRNIQQGDWVRLENGRGWYELRAKVTTGVRPGVVVTPKGRWSKLGNGRNVNWLTSDALGDMCPAGAGQSTFHSSRVWLRRVTEYL